MRYFGYGLVSIFTIAGFLLAGARPAFGELVFDDEIETQQAAAPAAVAPTPVAAQVVQQQTSAVEVREEVRKEETRAEQLRRQRIREEVKNEDILSQKIEELRLRDEQKRTTELLGSGIEKKDEKLETTPVVPPANQNVPAQGVDVSTSAIVVPAVPMEKKDEKKAEDKTSGKSEADVTKSDDGDVTMRLTLAPRAGYSAFTNLSYGLRPTYAAGVGVGLDVSEHFSIQAGYTYATYSMAVNNMFPGYPYNNAYNSNMNANSSQLELNDNLFDVGVRAHATGIKSKFRPFVGAGGAYRMGYFNYDDRTLQLIRNTHPSSTQDIEISGFSGYAEAGLEVGLSKHIALVGSGRYYNTFTSRVTGQTAQGVQTQRNGLLYNGFNHTSFVPGNLANNLGIDNTKNDAGSSIARSNFYQLMLGLQFGF